MRFGYNFTQIKNDKKEDPEERANRLLWSGNADLIDKARETGGEAAALGTALKLGTQHLLNKGINAAQAGWNAIAKPVGAFTTAATAGIGEGEAPATQPTSRQQQQQQNTAPAEQAAGQQNAAPVEKPSLGDTTTISGPGGFQAQRVQNQDGTYTLTMGKPGEAGSGSMTYSQMREPGSNFRNYGFDPNQARLYQQTGPNTYQGGGYTFQGSGADAARFFQPVHPSAHTPQANNSTFLKYRQQELAEEAARRAQAQMPEAPEGGWQTKLGAYRAQMDAYTQALNRQNALDVARIGNEQQAQRLGLDQQRLGFDQEQARQAMNLQRAQLGLQADQNIVNRAKTLADMEREARGEARTAGNYGYNQAVAQAIMNGAPPEEIARLRQAAQAAAGEWRKGTEESENEYYTPQTVGDRVVAFNKRDGSIRDPEQEAEIKLHTMVAPETLRNLRERYPDASNSTLIRIIEENIKAGQQKNKRQ